MCDGRGEVQARRPADLRSISTGTYELVSVIGGGSGTTSTRKELVVSSQTESVKLKDKSI